MCTLHYSHSASVTKYKQLNAILLHFPLLFTLAWKPLLPLASWFSLPLSPEGVRMLLPYPDLLFKRRFIAKEGLDQRKAKRGYLSVAPCVRRVPWGYSTPEAVRSDLPGGLVGTLSACKSYISNFGHYRLGNLILMCSQAMVPFNSALAILFLEMLAFFQSLFFSFGG